MLSAYMWYKLRDRLDYDGYGGMGVLMALELFAEIGLLFFIANRVL